MATSAAITAASDRYHGTDTNINTNTHTNTFLEPMDYEGLSTNQRELLLTIDHTCSYHRAFFEPMARNLTRRFRRGEPLDFELAIRGFMHGVNGAAREYNREHGSMRQAWHKLFPISDRRVVAERLARYAIDEIKANGGWS